MRYNVTGEFVKISETTGTIQNMSNVYAVEVSNKAEADSGILLYPLNKLSFNAPTLYMRCTDAGGWAECRVVTFIASAATSSSSVTDDFANDDDVEKMLNDIIFSGSTNYPGGDEADGITDEMWGSDNPDTDDGFSDAIDDIYGF